MNVIDAIESRRSIRAFKPQPVSKDVLLKILAAANWSPSWADTQPWEVFVAGGEPLAQHPRAFSRPVRGGGPMANDVPRPQEWPPGPMQRMLDFVDARCAAMGVVPGDEAEREASMRRNFEFFDAPVVVYPLPAQGPDALVVFRPGPVRPEPHAGRHGVLGGVGRRRQPGGISGRHPRGAGRAGGLRRHDRDRPRLRGPRQTSDNRCRSIRRPVEDAVAISGL